VLPPQLFGCGGDRRHEVSACVVSFGVTSITVLCYHARCWTGAL